MENFFFGLLFFAPFAVAGLVKLIYDFSTSDVEYNAGRLAKIRKRILKSLVEHGFETFIVDGDDYVKHNGKTWRISVFRNEYGSATVWLNSYYTLSENFPNVTPDGIRLAASYAGSQNWFVNFVLRDINTTICVVCFHYDTKNGDGFISALKAADKEADSFNDDFNKMIVALDDKYLIDRQKNKRRVGFHQGTQAEEVEEAEAAAVVAQAEEISGENTLKN